MGFQLPTLNLVVNVWRHGVPTSAPPSLVVMGNLAWGKRVSSPASGGTGDLGIVFTAMTLLLPAGTDIRDDYSTGLGDTVEVPAGTGRLYKVAVWDDIGRGFGNEHRAAVLTKIPPWPVPSP